MFEALNGMEQDPTFSLCGCAMLTIATIIFCRDFF
jgi:hypothetical protein